MINSMYILTRGVVSYSARSCLSSGSARRLSARPSDRQVGLRVAGFTIRDTIGNIKRDTVRDIIRDTDKGYYKGYR